MKVLHYTAVLAVVLGCLEAALPPENRMPGGWFDIEDAANDEKVQQMADFAANEMGYKVVAINAAQSAVSDHHHHHHLVIDGQAPERRGRGSILI